MKRSILIFLITLLFIPLSFAKAVKVSGNTVSYYYLDDLSSNMQRQASKLLYIEETWPGKQTYMVAFQNEPYRYRTVYMPQEDVIIKGVFRFGVTRNNPSRREIEYEEFISEEVYFGKTKERLLQARDRGINKFALADDVITETENIICYAAPGFEARITSYLTQRRLQGQ